MVLRKAEGLDEDQARWRREGKLISVAMNASEAARATEGSRQMIGSDSPLRTYNDCPWVDHVTMATEIAGRSVHPTPPE